MEQQASRGPAEAIFLASQVYSELWPTLGQAGSGLLLYKPYAFYGKL